MLICKYSLVFQTEKSCFLPLTSSISSLKYKSRVTEHTIYVNIFQHAAQEMTILVHNGGQRRYRGVKGSIMYNGAERGEGGSKACAEESEGQGGGGGGFGLNNKI
jgi:hypothetical protein